MLIHTVAPGDTVYSIAQNYGVLESRLIRDNMLRPPYDLAVGQTLVIRYPKTIYTVKEGDTLTSIAAMYGTDVENLLRNNPILQGDYYIYPGQTLVIEFDDTKTDDMTVYGYAYPFISDHVLRTTLPYLTYLSLFSYGFTQEGELIPLEDTDVIQVTSQYKTKPVLTLTSLSESGRFDNTLTDFMLNNMEVQDNLIQNLLQTMAEKGYAGLDVDLEYINPENKEAFSEFIRRLSDILHANGFELFLATPPKTSPDQPGFLYEAYDYPVLGEYADKMVLMTYEWGYSGGPPMAVAPINKVREVLDYAITEIPRDKIIMGIPNYGYDWTLPFEEGRRARNISNTEAVEIAERFGAEILYDEIAQSPYFYYTDDNGCAHIVWFEDARSIEEKLKLASEYGLDGVAYWNLQNYFPQNWLILNSMYNVNEPT